MAPRAHARVRDIDRGFRRYRREAAGVSVPRLVVGVTEESGRERHADNGATAAEVALFVEFGTRHQAPSPFLRTAADTVSGDARDACIVVAERGPSAAAARDALDALGREAAARVRDQVEAMGLVDEGVLRDAIGHEVRS